jgi:hypothetical protein
MKFNIKKKLILSLALGSIVLSNFTITQGSRNAFSRLSDESKAEAKKTDIPTMTPEELDKQISDFSETIFNKSLNEISSALVDIGGMQFYKISSIVQIIKKNISEFKEDYRKSFYGAFIENLHGSFHRHLNMFKSIIGSPVTVSEVNKIAFMNGIKIEGVTDKTQDGSTKVKYIAPNVAAFSLSDQLKVFQKAQAEGTKYFSFGFGIKGVNKLVNKDGLSEEDKNSYDAMVRFLNNIALTPEIQNLPKEKNMIKKIHEITVSFYTVHGMEIEAEVDGWLGKTKAMLLQLENAKKSKIIINKLHVSPMDPNNKGIRILISGEKDIQVLLRKEYVEEIMRIILRASQDMLVKAYQNTMNQLIIGKINK